MSRKVYISDNLVDMREHFKRNYEKVHGENATENDSPAFPDEEDKVVPPEKIVPPTETYLPSVKNKNADDSFSRDRRELEGMILHDLALADQKLKLLNEKISELETFRNILDDERDRLFKSGERADSAGIGMLRMEYFSAKGRWEAFDQQEYIPEKGSSYSPVSENRSSSLLAACAVLAGSIIISLVLIGLFS
jgi:hypothetical protein